MAVLGISHESGPLVHGNREIHRKYLNKLIMSLHVLNFLGKKFHEKFFCNPKVTMKIMKLFCYGNFEPYGSLIDVLVK